MPKRGNRRERHEGRENMDAANPQQTKKYKRSDNVIPDFEHLFDEDAAALRGKKKRRGVGLLYYRRLLQKKQGRFLFEPFYVCVQKPSRLGDAHHHVEHHRPRERRNV